MRRLAISAPIATAAITTSIASIAARAAASAAKSARIAAASAAATLLPLAWVLPLPYKGVCANISKRRFHGIRLRSSG